MLLLMLPPWPAPAGLLGFSFANPALSGPGRSGPFVALASAPKHAAKVAAAPAASPLRLLPRLYACCLAFTPAASPLRLLPRLCRTLLPSLQHDPSTPLRLARAAPHEGRRGPAARAGG